MLRKAAARTAIGFAFGVLTGQIVMIAISLCIADGKLHQVLPDFRALFDNELDAVIAQTFLTGLIGTVFAASSVLFEIERWSVLKQCSIHFLITAAIWIPVVYILWKPQSIQGYLSSLASFLGTYITIWLTQYFISRNDIRKINIKIKTANGGNQNDCD